jgi:hypothetical protein
MAGVMLAAMGRLTTAAVIVGAITAVSVALV